jgi:hypothetical protein
MMKPQISTLLLGALSVLSAASQAQVSGNNTQAIKIKGTVVNSAKDGATARINIGSVTGARVSGSNNQKVFVGGTVVNTAKGRGTVSEVNIGSVTR